ncbi:MAG TPA: hypothetical protein VFW63_01945, partial [Acidimicrobiales bacterium]|nr:hypothetical protein [Acidimicrobiales bacterium]
GRLIRQFERGAALAGFDIEKTELERGGDQRTIPEPNGGAARGFREGAACCVELSTGEHFRSLNVEFS